MSTAMEPIRTVGHYPAVTAVMVTSNRLALREKALKCFDSQTYQPRHIVVLDTSDPIGHDGTSTGPSICRAGNALMAYRTPGDLTIGELRNMANGIMTRDTEIIVHFDDDDYSHPNRIAEQVALLQSSGADAVGYNEMLFWRGESDLGCQIAGTGEAWLYSNPRPDYALGTSLCYWRKAWERRPFAALPLPGGRAGEDQDWLDGIASGRGPGVKLWSVSTIAALVGEGGGAQLWAPNGQPRMIARIHGGNTSTAYDPALMRASEMQGSGWRRVPEWDSYCREVMEC